MVAEKLVCAIDEVDLHTRIVTYSAPGVLWGARAGANLAPEVVGAEVRRWASG